MTTLYFIRGLPGSGKSTLAQHLVFNGLAGSYYEADMFFKGAVFNPKHLPHAHNWCFEMAEKCLGVGISTVVSNTSTTEEEVDRYQKLAEKHNAQFISIVVENRHGNKSIHDVPETTVEKMRNRFSIKL